MYFSACCAPLYYLLSACRRREFRIRATRGGLVSYECDIYGIGKERRVQEAPGRYSVCLTIPQTSYFNQLQIDVRVLTRNEQAARYVADAVTSPSRFRWRSIRAVRTCRACSFSEYRRRPTGLQESSLPPPSPALCKSARKFTSRRNATRDFAMTRARRARVDRTDAAACLREKLSS